MSTVSGTGDSSSFHQFQRTIDNLEEEHETESKKSRQKSDKKLQMTLDNSAANLKRQQDSSANSLRAAQESLNRTLSSERDGHRQEIKKLQGELYDKNGRQSSNDAETARQQLRDGQGFWDRRHEADLKSLSESDQRHSDKLGSKQRESDERLEKSVRSARDSAADAYGSRLKGLQKEKAESYQAEQRQLWDTQRRHQEDMETIHHQTREHGESMKNDYERRSSMQEQYADEKLTHQLKNSQEHETKNTAALTKSHKGETNQLRSQIEDLLQTEPNYRREKGEGAAEAIKKYDSDNRSERQQIVEGYEQERGRYKDKYREMERHQNDIYDKGMREKDETYGKRIADVHREHQSNSTNSQRELRKSQEQAGKSHQKALDLTRKNYEGQLEDSEIKRNDALTHQAAGYQKMLTSQRGTSDDRIESLEKQLTEKNTTDDPDQVSPAAERVIRNSVTQHLQKSLDAEQARNQRGQERANSEYQHRLQDVLDTKNSEITRAHRDANVSTSQLRTEMNGLQQEMNVTQSAESLDRHVTQTRELENLQRTHSRELENQRRHYEDISKASMDDARAKGNGARQDLVFESKMAQRTFSNAQNELIREYEKKLADQRIEHETLLRDTKTETDRVVRDQERKTRQEVEGITRHYEQQLSQQEMQGKEREKTVAQSYQDQLEKVKRSNALLIKKKS